MFATKLRIALLGLCLLSSMTDAAIIESGDAAVSGFSGTVIKGGAPFIKTDGASLKVFDLNNRAPAQAQLLTPPVKLEVLSQDIGQVFGIALDNDTPPNIYATSTAAYGLHIVVPDANGDGFPDPVKTGQAGASFMDGQFGSGGNAGSVWKIDGGTGQVTLFATLQNNGVDNGGAGLGNIVFDPTRYLLYVSDLESGLIHQLDMNGNLLGTFDHGVQGRPNEGLSVVNDDGVQADITNPAFDSDNSNTWGLTDIRRRVWGLALYKGLLYYAVGDGPQIWSVGFKNDGSFANNAKIEIKTVPGGLPVTDILFTPRGEMILAQRGGLLGGSDFLQFHVSSNNAVLRYRRDANGQWIQQPDEYAIGFPPNHRNTSGGVALACDNVLWSTGDNLRNTPMLAGTGALVVHGLQGNKVSLVRPRNVPPWASWFVDYDGLYGDDTKSGHVGDVELYRECNGTQDDWPGWEPLPPDWTFPPTWTPPPWWPPTPDLEIEKSDTQCSPTPLTNQALRECTFTITITNVGGAAYNGFLTVTDNIPNNTLFVPPPGGSIPWNCTQPAGIGTPVECISAAPQTLLPGTSETVDITLSFPPAFQGDRLNNCATVIETGGNPNNNDDCGQGFEPGPDLELLKTLDTCAQVPGGAQCSYWLDVTNVGNALFNGPLHISETLPAGASFLGVIASSNAGWTCFGAAGTADCWLPPVALGNGGNEWVEISIFVPTGGPANQENCITLGQPEHLTDPDINGNNSACAPVILPLPRQVQLLKGPGINFCPVGWTRQQQNWQPQKGWEIKTVGEGKDAITCGRKMPERKLVCPHGWVQYPPGASVPQNWEVKILGGGKKTITCAKPPLVAPVPVYTPPPVRPQKPHCQKNETRYTYRDQVPHNWSVRRVTRSGNTILCAKRKPVAHPPRCYRNEIRFTQRKNVPYNWRVRRVTQSGYTIWCATRPKPVIHLPHCYKSERQFNYRNQIPYSWSVRRVTRSGRTIWCAKPKAQRHCPHGTHAYHGRCIPNATHTDHGYDNNHPVLHCPRGTRYYRGRCVPIRRPAVKKHYPKHNPHHTIQRCKRGTYLSHGRCVPIRRPAVKKHYPKHNPHHTIQTHNSADYD